MIKLISSGLAFTAAFTNERLGIFNVKDYGAKGDGVADDVTAINAALAAASVVGGAGVLLPPGVYRFTSTIAIPAKVRLFGLGPELSVLRRGFNGTMITITGVSHASVTDLSLDGNAPTFTGKGIVVSGAGTSLRPYFNNLWSVSMGAVTDTHLEFGADAGQLANVTAWNFRLGGGTTNFRAVHTNGPDTGFAGRIFVACQAGNGYFDLSGAVDTEVSACTAYRFETSAATSIISIMGCVWANLGVAMTLNGSVMMVMGCRFSGNVTLSATFLGCFIGNIQTDSSYTFTNNSNVAGDAVIHSVLANNDMTAHTRLVTRTSGSGSAGVNLPHGSAPSAPVNGDLWTTTAGLFVRINGVTVGPLT